MPIDKNYPLISDINKVGIKPMKTHILIFNPDGSLYCSVKRDLINVIQKDNDGAYYMYLGNAGEDWIQLTAEQIKQVLEQLD